MFGDCKSMEKPSDIKFVKVRKPAGWVAFSGAVKGPEKMSGLERGFPDDRGQSGCGLCRGRLSRPIKTDIKSKAKTKRCLTSLTQNV